MRHTYLSIRSLFLSKSVGSFSHFCFNFIQFTIIIYNYISTDTYTDTHLFNSSILSSAVSKSVSVIFNFLLSYDPILHHITSLSSYIILHTIYHNYVIYHYTLSLSYIIILFLQITTNILFIS